MSESTDQRKFSNGIVRIVDTVELAPVDGATREMGVVWVEENDDTRRYTDFSSMHKSLELDQPVRLVYTEAEQQIGNFTKVHRNLVTVTQ
jgi:hypothetical protein